MEERSPREFSPRRQQETREDAADSRYPAVEQEMTDAPDSLPDAPGCIWRVEESKRREECLPDVYEE
jgi:hypothetical protein